MSEQSIVYKFLPLAENTARKWYRICQGEARGIELEDVLAEAVSLLPSIAKTYKPERGSVVAVVKPAVWRHLERKFARSLHGEIERPTDEADERAEDASQERAALAARVREWAAGDADRQALVLALDSGAALTTQQRELLAELRTHMGAAPKLAGLWSAGRAARYLRMPEKRMRELCESGAVAAVRDRGWCVSRQEADKYRRRVIRDALHAGATTRAAAQAAGAGRETARKVLRATCEPRRRGRAPQHDRAELFAALTDATRAPHTWRNGVPCARAVARYIGCHHNVVLRAMVEVGYN